MQRIIGRVININPDENSKLCDSNIGLLNLSDDNSGPIQKLKLNVTNLPSFSFYDGEIIVVEGTYDSTKTILHVIAVTKPAISTLP